MDGTISDCEFENQNIRAAEPQRAEEQERSIVRWFDGSWARAFDRSAVRQYGRDRGQRSEIRSQESGLGRFGDRAMQINSAPDLIVYQRAFALAMRIFEVSKQFPPEERYSLTGQIRRASRSVCTNLREAWAKRRYVAHFVSKLTDSDGENAETDGAGWTSQRIVNTWPKRITSN